MLELNQCLVLEVLISLVCDGFDCLEMLSKAPHCVWLLIRHNMIGYSGQEIPLKQGSHRELLRKIIHDIFRVKKGITKKDGTPYCV